ncbi:MAG: CDP-alcohol phosphatidyltransferase family protein [Chlamydiota bacterium]
MGIANYLTFIRVFISPIFMFIYLSYDAWNISYVVLPYILLFLLLTSDLSDLADGYLARKLHQVTDFGKIIDPMADSMVRISVFLAFTTGPVQLPIALVFILIYRESVISALRTVCALRGIALAARISGKIKATLQGITATTITILMIPQSLGYLSLETFQVISLWLMAGVSIYTIFSAIDYIYANRNLVKKLLTLKPRNL